MACCRRCSIFIGEDDESAPLCEMCGQPVVYCSEEKCSTQECALRCHGIDDIEQAEPKCMDEDLSSAGRKGLDYFGLAKSGWQDDDLRSLSKKGPRSDPFS